MSSASSDAVSLCPDPPSPSESAAMDPEKRIGIACGLGAYLWWGLFPIYLRYLTHSGVSYTEIVCHRVIWSFACLTVAMFALRKWSGLFDALRERRTWGLLVGSSVAIATNWIVFIIAIGHDKLSQCSLGYYINPLVSVLFGRIFLGERLRPLQKAALGLAAAGVLVLTVRGGEIPVVALLLALSFASYGLLRKVVRADSLQGLTFETALQTPFAIGAMIWLGATQGIAFGSVGASVTTALAFAGIATAIPLLLFASAARRLELATIGFMQFLTPTMQLLLAVFAYDEAFTTWHAVAFGCIWGALGLYTRDMWGARRKQSPAA